MLADRLTPRARRILRADLWVTIGPTVLIIAAAFGVTMLFVKPAPPKRLTAAIAPDEGGSKYYARRYQEILKRPGITLEVRQTAGSLANVQLLAEPDSGVDIAFVQSGTDAGEKAARIESLGSVSYVPLWIFYRGEPIDDVRALKGRRVAVGAPESGTRALAATVPPWSAPLAPSTVAARARVPLSGAPTATRRPFRARTSSIGSPR